MFITKNSCLVDDDSLPVATDAFVFMVVALNSYWKLAIGYFLINGLSGEERANLVNTTFTSVTDTNAKPLKRNFLNAIS